jgi:hypothetical protein
MNFTGVTKEPGGYGFLPKLVSVENGPEASLPILEFTVKHSSAVINGTQFQNSNMQLSVYSLQ